ncbi:MAG TPA: bifunctional ADP-heptose synthase [Candidatus Acidoferrales bacterium]|nr:bifunctional ADP-heptose synthase [Candidatus Acidoferrales bacterium]
MRRTRKQINGAARSPDLSRLLDIVSAFPRQKIAVLGDFVVDEYVTGEISRVSREAPVLILRHKQTEIIPGGGANAANNLADLGASVFPIGAIGDDAAGDALVEYFRRKQVDVSGIIRVRGWTTTTKTRFLARWTHTSRQQVLRVDREPETELTLHVAEQIIRKGRARIAKCDAVIVSDYGAGSVTPLMLKKLHPRVATLDSRYRLLDYRGAKITAATPNEPELEALYHSKIGNDRQTLDALGQRTLGALKLGALLVTRGKDGMVLFERAKAPHEIRVHGSDDAVDVTGAGDTVIAVFTLALAAGASFVEAAHLANYAGGIVVMKRGTATVTRAELETAIRVEATAGE